MTSAEQAKWRADRVRSHIKRWTDELTLNQHALMRKLGEGQVVTWSDYRKLSQAQAQAELITLYFGNSLDLDDESLLTHGAAVRQELMTRCMTNLIGAYNSGSSDAFSRAITMMEWGVTARLCQELEVCIARA